VGRRSMFFGALALLCLIMIEPTPDQYRWVNLVGAGLALFWCVMLFLEHRSLARVTPARRRPPKPGRRG
jgi:hypothetical protein